MRVVLIAAGPFGLPTLEALVASPIDIPLVITQPDRKRGRGRRLTPTAIHAAATARGLEVVTAPDINAPEMIELARACAADVGVVIDFGQKIGPEFRSEFRGECVNLHGSLLPRLRGAAPYQWAILRGEETVGVTVFKLVDRMDAGNLLTSAETVVDPLETADELHDRLALLGPRAVIEAVGLFEAGRVPEGMAQDDSEATTAPKLKKDDGLLDFGESCGSLVRRIHGLWSWPGARCRFVSADGGRDEMVTLGRARVASGESHGGPPGTLTDELRVAGVDGVIEVLEIKPQSGKLMSWSAYTHGRRVRPGDRFVAIQT